MTKKLVNKNYKIAVNMNSLLERVYNRITLLEAGIIPKVSSDYPVPITKSETPSFLKRGEQFSKDIKQNIDAAIAGAMPDKKGAFYDFSKSFAHDNNRDFTTSAYSRKAFFKNAGRGKVVFVYFLTSAQITESFTDYLSNYSPFVKVDQSVLDNAKPISKDIYKYLIEDTSGADSIFSRVMYLQDISIGIYAYKINDSLFMAIGTYGQYLNLLSSSAGQSTGSSKLVEYATSNETNIKNEVINKLRSTGIYDLLNKHPLFSMILNRSSVNIDSIRAALMDYLNIAPLISATNISGKKYANILTTILANPHQHFYGQVQYASEKIVIPESVNTAAKTVVESASIKMFNLPALLDHNLADILTELKKMHGKEIKKTTGSTFTRMSLIMGGLEKKMRSRFSGLGIEADFAKMLLTGVKREKDDKGFLPGSSCYKIFINPNISTGNKTAFKLKADSWEVKKAAASGESDAVSQAALYIPSYSQTDSIYSLELPMTSHKWILDTLTKTGKPIVWENYKTFLINELVINTSSSHHGTQGRDNLMLLLEDFWKEDGPNSNFLKKENIETTFGPDYLLLAGDENKILIKSPITFLTEFANSHSDAYEICTKLGEFRIKNRDYKNIITPKRPLLVLSDKFTPLHINMIDIQRNGIDPVLKEAILEDVSYIHFKEAAEKVKSLRAYELMKYLNNLYQNCSLGFYGDSSSVFMTSADITTSGGIGGVASIVIKSNIPDIEVLTQAFLRYYVEPEVS